jgi:hypothetical protein
MVLDLPPTLQKNGWSCGEAAARCVFAYHERRAKLPHATAVDGTDPRSLEAAFRRAGLPVLSGSMDLDDLKHQTGKGKPVVCLVTEGATGHYVVVAGVAYRSVHYLDPLHGPKREPAAAFLARWHDWDRHGATFERWGISVG